MRVGLVGAGPWARVTGAPSLHAHPGVDFVGVWARRPEAAAELHPVAFSSFQNMLDAVDAVAFAVPPAVQSGLAQQAARAGKHLILDKPIAANLVEAVELCEAVDDADVRSIVTFTRRFAPETRKFLAEAQALGGVSGSGTWLSGALLGGDYSASPWRQESGAIMDVGPHILDLLDASLGETVDVWWASRDIVSDTWTLVLGHQGGATSTVRLSLRTPIMPSVLNVSVSGADGIADLTDRSTSSVDCYRVLLDEFLACVENGTEHPLNAARGLHIQRVIDMVVRAVR